VQIEVVSDRRCIELMERFIATSPDLRKEDIGAYVDHRANHPIRHLRSRLNQGLCASDRERRDQLASLEQRTLLVIGMSSYLCLRVVWLYRSDTASLISIDEFWLDLQPVRDQRTRWYRAAWMLAQLALVGVAVSAVLDSFGL
jgi:hypothetical protein